MRASEILHKTSSSDASDTGRDVMIWFALQLHFKAKLSHEISVKKTVIQNNPICCLVMFCMMNQASSSPWLSELTPKSKSLETFQIRFFLFFLLSAVAFQFTCRLRWPFRRRTCCLSLDFAFWSEVGSHKRGKGEAEEEAEAREKILIECSPPDNEFSPPFKCICRMLEWFITADPKVWQWTSEMSDAIFLLISFPWSSLSPWPVYLY